MFLKQDSNSGLELLSVFNDCRDRLEKRKLIKNSITSPILAFALVLGCFETVVSAQVLPPQADITRLRPPTIPLPVMPQFDLRLETPEQSPIPRAVDDLRFKLRDIVIEGISINDPEFSKERFAPLIGPEVGLEDIRAAAAAFEETFRKRGFFLVRVLVPAQQLKDDTLKIQVIEGFIESVYAQGGTEAMRKKADALIQPLLQLRPISLSALEHALLSLNDLPGVAGGGVLRQGRQLGGTELIVNLLDSTPNIYSVGLNNAGPKTLGIYGASLNASVNNPFGHVGQLSFGFNGALNTHQLRTFNARYSTDIGGTGLIASLGVLSANAQPAGTLKEVLGLSVISQTESVTPRLRYALFRGREHSLYLDSGLALTQTKISGVPNPECDTGSPKTLDKLSNAELGLSWVWSQPSGHLQALSINFHQGISRLGALRPRDYDFRCKNPSTRSFDPSFQKLSVSIQRSQILGAGFSAQFQSLGQWTHNNLLSGERIAFGGTMIGRGYDGGAIAGDRGYGALLELRYDVQPKEVSDLIASRDQLQLFVFADGARTITLPDLADSKTSSRAASIVSSGIGARFKRSTTWSADLWIANGHKTINSADPRGNPRLVFNLNGTF